MLNTLADQCICVICAVLLDALCMLLTAMQGPGHTCRQQLKSDDAIDPPGPLGWLCRGLLFFLGSRPSPARQQRHQYACWPLSANSSLRKHPQVLRSFSFRATSAQCMKFSRRREKLTSSFPLRRLWQQKHGAQTGPHRPQSLRSPRCPPP